MKKIKRILNNDRMVNLLLYIIGLVVMPCGVVLTIKAHLGAGGYDAWNFALGDFLGIAVSKAIYISAIVSIVITAVVRRAKPRFTTFITSFFLGIFTDMWNKFFQNVEGKSFGVSLILLLIGMFIISVAAAAYMCGEFPPGPTDDLVVALHARGLPLGPVKVTFDFLCVTMAWILGGEIGVGTILLTFGMGPTIQFFYTKIEMVLKKIKTNGVENVRM